jgi:hypothetical protein
MTSECRKRLSLAGFSLLLTLLFAEIALRLLGIGDMGQGTQWFAGGNHPRFLFQPDAASGYTLRPGFRGREIAHFGEFDVPVVVDARGLREHPHRTDRRPVILALGDSMTFGEGVPVDRTWTAILERETGFRVENGGVPGYSTQQMAARGRRLIPLVQPDLVLVTFSPHWDRQRCATPFVYFGGYIVAQGYLARLHLIDGNVYLAETRLPGIGRATAYTERYSYLARLALPVFGDGARAVLKAARGQEEPPAADYGPTVAALASIREQARRAGAGFLAILIESRGRKYQVDRSGLEKALKAQGLPYLALDAFLARADWLRLRFPRDQHWNAAGHRTVGKALAPVVRSLMAKP